MWSLWSMMYPTHIHIELYLCMFLCLSITAIENCCEAAGKSCSLHCSQENRLNRFEQMVVLFPNGFDFPVMHSGEALCPLFVHNLVQLHLSEPNFCEQPNGTLTLAVKTFHTRWWKCIKQVLFFITTRFWGICSVHLWVVYVVWLV